MPHRAPSHTFLLFTGDTSLQSYIQKQVEPAHLTVVRDLRAMSRLMAKRSFSGVIMETKRDRPNDLAEIQRLIDPKETFLLAGSSSALRDAPQVVSTLARTNGHVQKAPPLTFRLDDYLESKIGDFVRAMREGSARNLHATLIKAVERPLLVRVLRETNGNQIQAAELLGMNRNTLRKKLKEFKIPVMRERS
jgi:two-component system nitrogen regulation response regulator GlnG